MLEENSRNHLESVTVPVPLLGCDVTNNARSHDGAAGNVRWALVPLRSQVCLLLLFPGPSKRDLLLGGLPSDRQSRNTNEIERVPCNADGLQLQRLPLRSWLQDETRLAPPKRILTATGNRLRVELETQWWWHR